MFVCLFVGEFLVEFCRKLVEYTGGVENLEVIKINISDLLNWFGSLQKALRRD